MGLGSDSLIKWLEPLSEIYDLTFIDLRGCGDSEKASDDSYTLNDFSNDIIEITKTVSKGNKMGILGHSLGGMVAIDVLSKSNLFQFSILANTAMNSKWQTSSQDAVKKMNDMELQEQLKAYANNPSDNTIRELAITYAPIYFPELDKNSAREIMKNFNYRNDTISFTAENVYPSMNLLPQLKKINIPSLIISGSRDVVVPQACQEDLSKNLKNSSLVSIKDAGHFPFISKNTDFTNATKSWWHLNSGVYE